MPSKKLVNLQLVILGLLDSKAEDISSDDLQAAWKESQVIPLLRSRYGSDPTFIGFYDNMRFDSLEEELENHLAIFFSETGKYDFKNSGLCIIAGAISYGFFSIRPE